MQDPDIAARHPRRTRMRLVAVLAGGAVAVASGLVGGAVAAPAAQAADCSTVPWMDASKTPEQRADALLAASTLQQEYRWLDEQAANSPATTTFSGVTYPAQVDCTPTVVYTDGPDGVRSTTGVTAFPGPLAMGATWDTSLNEQRGAVMGDEAFNKRKNGILGPGASSGRTPLAGRTPEYFGEEDRKSVV